MVAFVVVFFIVALIGAAASVADFYTTRMWWLSRFTMKSLTVSSFIVPAWMLPFVSLSKYSDTIGSILLLHGAPVVAGNVFSPRVCVCGVSGDVLFKSLTIAEATVKIEYSPIISAKRIRVLVRSFNGEVTLRKIFHAKTMIRCFIQQFGEIISIIDKDATCSCEWCADLKRMVK